VWEESGRGAHLFALVKEDQLLVKPCQESLVLGLPSLLPLLLDPGDKLRRPQVERPLQAEVELARGARQALHTQRAL